MDHQAAIELIKHERPSLVPTLQALTAAVSTQPTLRKHVNDLFLQMLEMQVAIAKKRSDALSLMRKQDCVFDELTGRSFYLALRHIPDVQIRTLCRIAECEHVSNATPEWLDKMEQKHANG